MSRYIRPLVAWLPTWIAILVAFGASVRVVAQAPAQLSGVVVSADGQSQPIRRAIVTLASAELPMNLSVVSDDRGAFAFVNLPAGTYSVTASKAAYLKTAFGATKPGQPGTPMVLRAGQRLADVRLTLARGAVLSGTIRDASGVPAAGVPVAIAPATQINGASDYASPDEGPIVTDERGGYRAYGLAPGEYVIAATPRMPGPGSTTRIAVRLPSQTIDALLRELQARASGRPVTPAAAASTSQPGLSYAPIYFPGTPVVQDAGRIRVSAGEVREGCDFALDLVPSATVEGRVVMADGSELPRVQLSLAAVGPPLPVFWSMSFGSNQRADGTFSFVNLTPGRYVLTAKGTPGATSADTITSAGRGSGAFPARPMPGALWAMTDVVVNGADLTGITLSLRPAFSFGGRVVFDRTTLAAPPDLTKLRVGLLPAAPPGSSISQVGVPVPQAATVGADGAFVVNSVMPGVYAPISSVPGMPGWRLRSAVVNGRDLLDVPMEFGPASTDVRDAVLTFSDRHSKVSGVLASDPSQSTAGFSAIIFPVDRVLWSSNRRLLSSRFASDGRYTFSDVTSGEYWIAVVTDLDPEAWKQASFLEQAIAASTRVVVAEGATVHQDLKIR